MNELFSFGMYLTGHNQKTIEQMYADWIGQRITVKGFDTYVDGIKFSNFTLNKKGSLLEINNGRQKAMIKLCLMDLSRFRRIIEMEGAFIVYGTIGQLNMVLYSLK